MRRQPFPQIFRVATDKIHSVGQVTPDLLEGITYGTYILFGTLTYLGAAFVWFFVPETKRLSLEEMVGNI